MTISNVSFLGQTTTQTGRLKDLNATLDDLERQISTGKKTETLAGLGGVTAQTVLLARAKDSSIQGYLDNITMLNTRINEMSQSMSSAHNAASQLISGITSAVHESSSDVGTLATLAKQSLSFLQDLANLNIDGRYLFSGSATTQQPFTDNNGLNANIQSQITSWLNGTITTAQLESNISSFSSTQAGFNPALSGAGPVTVHIDDSTQLDYTVNASQDGFQEIILAVGFLANLKTPGPGDTPTTADLNDALNKVLNMLQDGVAKLDTAQTNLASKSGLIGNIEDTHKQDDANLQTVIGNAENTDTTEAVVKLQALQTQLESSYQITSSVSKLSLVNYL